MVVRERARTFKNCRFYGGSDGELTIGSSAQPSGVKERCSTESMIIEREREVTSADPPIGFKHPQVHPTLRTHPSSHVLLL